MDAASLRRAVRHVELGMLCLLYTSALLAVWLGGDRRLGADLLRRSAEKKLESVRKVEEPDDSASLPMLALWYKRLRSTSAKTLIKGESAAALAMATALPRRPSSKQKQGRAASKP